MKIALVFPSSPFLMNELQMPPLGICYLSAVLKACEHEVEIVDLSGGRELPGIDADLVGISASTPQFSQAVTILRQLKKANPSQKVVIGGPHATVAPGSLLAAGFDAVVTGEGETGVVKLLWGAVGQVEGEEGDINRYPLYDKSFIRRYTCYLGERRAATMVTSRGCPYQCSFCCRNWGRKVRFRDADNVLLEASVLKNMGYAAVMFYDDEMLLDWERDVRIFNGLCAMDMTYRMFTRSNLVTVERANFLADTGCVEILMGIESGSDRILENIKKGTTRRMNVEAVRTLRAAGIKVKAAMIVGLPGEDEYSILETESFIEEAEPDDVDFTIFTPYPGSEIHAHPEDFDIVIYDGEVPYKTFQGNYVSIVGTKALTPDMIERARDQLEAKYKNFKAGAVQPAKEEL